MTWLFAWNQRYWPIVTAVLLAVVTLLCLIPLPEMELPGPLLNDKLQHLVSYAALALPVALARPRRWGPVILALAAWSGAIELIQPYVNRDGAWGDLLANCVGLAFGVALSVALRRMRRAA